MVVSWQLSCIQLYYFGARADISKYSVPVEKEIGTSLVKEAAMYLNLRILRLDLKDSELADLTSRGELFYDL